MSTVDVDALQKLLQDVERRYGEDNIACAYFDDGMACDIFDDGNTCSDCWVYNTASSCEMTMMNDIARRIREALDEQEPSLASDTQERIDEDAKKDLMEYWGCMNKTCESCDVICGKRPPEYYGVNGCGRAKWLDLLRRQRELDARLMGGEQHV